MWCVITDTRETSYLSAVTSAAVTYTITYACSTGAIEECGCGDERVGSYHLLKQVTVLLLLLPLHHNRYIPLLP